MVRVACLIYCADKLYGNDSMVDEADRKCATICSAVFFRYSVQYKAN